MQTIATITKAQLTKIHVLLNQYGFIENKKEFVINYSNGRTESSKELTKKEAQEIIHDLLKLDDLKPMRQKVFALAYKAGIIYGNTEDDYQMNYAKLNMFLKQRGAVKKEIFRMNKSELIKTVNQFEMIVKNMDISKGEKELKRMLTELNISI